MLCVNERYLFVVRFAKSFHPVLVLVAQYMVPMIGASLTSGKTAPLIETRHDSPLLPPLGCKQPRKLTNPSDVPLSPTVQTLSQRGKRDTALILLGASVRPMCSSRSDTQNGSRPTIDLG